MQWIFSQAFGGIYLREVFGICVYKYWLYYFVLFLHKTLRGFINCFILSFCGNWSVCVLIIYQRDVGICDQYCTVAICWAEAKVKTWAKINSTLKWCPSIQVPKSSEYYEQKPKLWRWRAGTCETQRWSRELRTHVAPWQLDYCRQGGGHIHVFTF